MANQELVELINNSESLTSKEKKDQILLLEHMNDEQKSELSRILVREADLLKMQPVLIKSIENLLVTMADVIADSFAVVCKKAAEFGEREESGKEMEDVNKMIGEI